MKAIVICPDRLSAFPFLSRTSPVALAPALGPSLLSHALTALAEAGAKQVFVLAADRPDEVRRAVGRGERWGLVVEVIAESRELTVGEARRKYRPENTTDWLPLGCDVVIADRPAGDIGVSPLIDGRSWFAALQDWLPRAHEHRVGVREIAPGVWVGLRTRIEDGAVIEGPCWLGEGVWVRSGAKVGPNALIEDESLIDHDAEIAESWVGPRTYVGAMTRVHRSLGWGRGLLNCATNSFIEVPDAFLLSELKAAQGRRHGSSLPGRLMALGLAVLTSPVALLAWWQSRRKQVACCARRRAVVPFSAGRLSAVHEVDYAEFPSLGGLWQRWPQLWNIVRGDFAWVGNRPIDREQAAELDGEFEQLWLAAPVGLVSLADAEGCRETFDEEARVHASYYAAQAGKQLDREILSRLFRQGLTHIL